MTDETDKELEEFEPDPKADPDGEEDAAEALPAEEGESAEAHGNDVPKEKA